MMQGVLTRGTAHGISRPGALCGGQDRHHRRRERCLVRGLHQRRHRCGRVGYDNADGKRRTLGGGHTGASVAVPIFEPIIQAAWAMSRRAPRSPRLRPEAKRDLVWRPVILALGELRGGGQQNHGIVEYLRREPDGRARDTR